MLHPLWTRVRRAMLVSTALVFAALVVTTSPASAQAQEWVITGEGLGPLRLGDPIDDVIASLPDGYGIADEVMIAPDLFGRAVSVDGEVHAVVQLDDAGSIDRVVVVSDGYATPDGVGPGVLIAEAEIVYGDAQLSWSADDRGRERVVFDDNPAGLSFRASEDGGPEAGIYGQGSVSVLYEPDAVLSSVWIVDPADDAFGPAPRPVVIEEPADTGGSETSPSDDPVPQELPRTGAETATVMSAALALVFTGLGITRVADRLRPWS